MRSSWRTPDRCAPTPGSPRDRRLAGGRTGSRRRREVWWRRSRCRTRASPPRGARGSRVHAVRDFGGEAVDELAERDAAFGIVAAARVHADGAVLDVVITDDEHVGNLLELG